MVASFKDQDEPSTQTSLQFSVKFTVNIKLKIFNVTSYLCHHKESVVVEALPVAGENTQEGEQGGLPASCP